MKKIIVIIVAFSFVLIGQSQTYILENFNTEIPNSWSITDAGDTAANNTWYSGQINGSNLDGSNCAIVDSDAEGNNPHPQLIEILTTPIVDTSGATNLFLDFDQYYRHLGSGFGKVEVFDGSTWVVLLNQTASTGAFSNPNHQAIDITAYKNTAMQVRFFYDDDDDWAWYWLVDNVQVYNTACGSPSNIIATNVTTDSATISWTANGSENSWEYVIQDPTLGTPTTSGVFSNTTTFNATGLLSSNTYEIYVRSNCGSDGFSIWTGPYQFSTASIPAPILFTQQSISTTGTNRAVVDMNGDYLDDIVSIGNTNINIQEQQASGAFIEKNITTPNADFFPSWSLAAADYDGNGYTDLLYGATSGVTFMRANADGTGFTEISGSQNVFSQRSNFIDINNDGHLDAFVCHDVAPNVYYINDGTGNLTFHQTPEDGTSNGAPHNLGGYASGGNYGSIWIDYDNDGDQDLFIAKCGGVTARRTNQMHTNDGNGNFTENAAAIGLADPMQTWSSAWGDYDNDGDMDVFVGSSDPNDPHKLMRNDMNTIGMFTEVTAGAGITGNLTTFNHENVPFDFDNDGILDIASNGDILFGNGDMTFTVYDNLVPDDGSFGDLNNDGFIDAFAGNIYMNNGNSNNWITINTVGTASNINGIGARIEIVTPSGTQIRDVRSGEGFRYMNTLNSHFGIGSDTSITSITIHWPADNSVDQILNPNINQSLTVIEGSNPILSVDEFLVDNLILYPNPTTHYLNINNSIDSKSLDYQIYDMASRLMFKGKLKSDAIDVSRLQSGNYILRISNNNLVKTQKFIKK